MKKPILLMLLALGAAACGREAKQESVEDSRKEAASSGQGKVLYYRDPMGGPDTSPVPTKDSMGMDYLPVYEGEAADADGEPSREDASPQKSADRTKPRSSDKGDLLYYRNPMGLADTSPVPKKDWMGMDYIPVYENEDAANDAAVAVPSETIQTLGVKIANAEAVDFGRTIRTFGAVADNARLLTEVTSRVDGWVDELAITAVGDKVQEGDLLFRLRSPDLIAAERDYATARNAGSAGWAKSSATRLKSLGVQDRTIAEFKARGIVGELTPFYAERNGIVSMLNVRKGAFVEAGDAIATIADYGEVWVIASIAEQDLPLITPGAPAAVSFPNAPDAARSAKVDYVYPTIDSKTRTGRVRLVLDNADLVLRPGAYADISFEIGSERRIAVPSEAILRDETGAHVVMAMGDGRFMPMPVKTGLVASGMTEITDGLAAGDAIVVSGQFLIDSESKLRESLGKLTPGNAGNGAGASSEKSSAEAEAPGVGGVRRPRTEAAPLEHENDETGSNL